MEPGFWCKSQGQVLILVEIWKRTLKWRRVCPNRGLDSAGRSPPSFGRGTAIYYGRYPLPSRIPAHYCCEQFLQHFSYKIWQIQYPRRIEADNRSVEKREYNPGWCNPPPRPRNSSLKEIRPKKMGKVLFVTTFRHNSSVIVSRPQIFSQAEIYRLI